MKISQATEQEKLIALAELDSLKLGSELGYSDYQSSLYYKPTKNGSYHSLHDWEDCYEYIDFKPLTSFDAIIPLIQKQPEEVKRSIWFQVRDFTDKEFTPLSISNALLIATGKFEL